MLRPAAKNEPAFILSYSLYLSHTHTRTGQTNQLDFQCTEVLVKTPCLYKATIVETGGAIATVVTLFK